MRVLFQVLIAILIVKVSFGQMGVNDSSFNPDDNNINGLGSGFYSLSQGETFYQLSDGRILGGISGQSNNYINGFEASYVYQLDQQGVYNPFFKMVLNPNSGYSRFSARAFGEQSDGKIIVGGRFDQVIDGVKFSSILRLFPDGTIDSSFFSVSGFQFNEYDYSLNTFSAFVNSVIVDENDKIYVGGKFEKYRNVYIQNIARLNSDGSIDPTFNAGNLLVGEIFSMFLQEDGKLLVGGDFIVDGVNATRNFVRLNVDGSRDMSFNSGTGFDQKVSKIIMSDDKIWLGGKFSTYNENPAPKICQLNENGTVDPTFNPQVGFDDEVKDIKVLSNGHLLAVGKFTQYNNEFANHTIMLTIAGEKVSSYDNSIPISTAYPNDHDERVSACMETSNNELLLTGDFSDYNGSPRMGLMRLDMQGNDVLDVVINSSMQVAGVVKLSNDGKVYVGTSNYLGLNFYKGKEVYGLFRIFANGDIDTMFLPKFNTNASISVIERLSDGKIVVGGIFNSVNNQPVKNIVVLNPDGSISSDWAIGFGINGRVVSIAVLPDDKMVVGGDFYQVNGVGQNNIVKMDKYGWIDQSFNIGSGFNSDVSKVQHLGNGRIHVNGYFSKYKDQTAKYSVILNSNGSLNSNNPLMASLSYRPIVHAFSDGKLLVLDAYSQGATQLYDKIIKVNTNGTIDHSFNYQDPNDYSMRMVRDFVVKSDGSIVINCSRNILKLYSNGSINHSFDYLGKFDQSVSNLDFFPDGRIIVGGMFMLFNNGIRTRLAVLNDCNNGVFQDIISSENDVLTCTDPIATSYQWYNCDSDQIIEGAISSSYAPTQTGSYYVLANSDCPQRSPCINVAFVGITNSKVDKFALFPNPTNGNVEIQFMEEQNDVSVTITDIMGRFVANYKYIASKEVGFVLEGKAGVYNVVVTTENGVVSKRVMLN